MLEILTLTLGPVQTNTYLVADPVSLEAVVIDPAWDGKGIVAEAAAHGWRIGQLWITHAHFDHWAGANAVMAGSQPGCSLAIHPGDEFLWQAQGLAGQFGLQIDPLPKPTHLLQHRQVLHLGDYAFEVRHAPGHSPGHVIYYCAAAAVAFCGDVIFQGGIGRTDLPGGDYDALSASIRQQVLTLPEETRLLPGHGLETTVGVERETNPFLY